MFQRTHPKGLTLHCKIRRICVANYTNALLEVERLSNDRFYIPVQSVKRKASVVLPAQSPAVGIALTVMPMGLRLALTVVKPWVSVCGSISKARYMCDLKTPQYYMQAISEREKAERKKKKSSLNLSFLCCTFNQERVCRLSVTGREWRVRERARDTERDQVTSAHARWLNFMRTRRLLMRVCIITGSKASSKHIQSICNKRLDEHYSYTTSQKEQFINSLALTIVDTCMALLITYNFHHTIPPPVISMYTYMLGDQCVPLTHRNEISIIQLAKHYLKIAKVQQNLHHLTEKFYQQDYVFLFSVQSFTF